MTSEHLSVLYSRPGLYLRMYEQRLDAASCFTNFLEAILVAPEFGTPDSIEISVTHHFFTIHANGCSLPSTMETSQHLSSAFNIAHFRQPFFDGSRALGVLRSIVWFSEHCLVDFTFAHTIYRQAFWRGDPAGQQLAIPLEGTPLIGLLFTLPGKPFTEITLPFGRLKHVIQMWEKHDLVQLLTPLKLHKEWCQQSDYHYSLRIVPE